MRIVLHLMFVIMGTATAYADDMTVGKTAFWKGDFKAAAAAYGKAVQTNPTHPDLWFNLGTAEAHAGRLGHAVHALEQAMLLDSGDVGAQHNLERVREQIIDQALKSSSGETLVLPGSDDLGTGLLASLPQRTLETLFSITWPLLFMVVFWVGRSASPGRRATFTFLAVVMGLVSLSTGGLLMARTYVVEQGRFGILVKERTTARRGPGSQYAASRIGGREKVKIAGQDRGGQQVTLPNGLGAWVESNHVKRLRGEERIRIRQAKRTILQGLHPPHSHVKDDT